MSVYRGIIYKFTFPNGKVYIGQTINPVSRKNSHLNEKTGARNIAFWRAYKKYKTYKYDVIESVEDETREGLCKTGTCASSCHNDGGVIRNSEGALLLAPGQSQKKGDGDPVHLLRHPCRECSPLGRAVG